MIKHVVLRNIILGLPGDPALRSTQADAMKWFWQNRKGKDFKRNRLDALQQRFDDHPSDPIAALLLTAAK